MAIFFFSLSEGERKYRVVVVFVGSDVHVRANTHTHNCKGVLGVKIYEGTRHLHVDEDVFGEDERYSPLAATHAHRPHPLSAHLAVQEGGSEKKFMCASEREGEQMTMAVRF